jgi:hypothetical protein
MFDYILQYPHEVLSKIFEHIELTVLAVSLGPVNTMHQNQDMLR